jgi:hypothetical protein
MAEIEIRLHRVVLGRRYRINQQCNKADGRVGTLESVINGEGWLKVAGFGLVRAPVECLTDRGVVQADLSIYRVRQDPPLVWGDMEQLA